MLMYINTKIHTNVWIFAYIHRYMYTHWHQNTLSNIHIYTHTKMMLTQREMQAYAHINSMHILQNIYEYTHTYTHTGIYKDQLINTHSYMHTHTKSVQMAAHAQTCTHLHRYIDK